MISLSGNRLWRISDFRDFERKVFEAITKSPVMLYQRYHMAGLYAQSYNFFSDTHHDNCGIIHTEMWLIAHTGSYNHHVEA